MPEQDKELREIFKKFYQQQYEHFSEEILDEAITALRNAGYVKKDEMEVDEKKIGKIIREFILFEYFQDDFVLPVRFQDFLKDKPDFFNALAHAIASKIRELIK